jgi:tight adherence protein C
MDELNVETAVYIASAGISVMLGSWLVIDSMVRARREAARHMTERGPASSLLFKMLRPFARWFGFIIGGFAAKLEMRLGRGAEQSFLLSARIRIERKLIAGGHPEGVTADEFLGLMIVGCLFGGGLGLLAFLRLQLLAVVFVLAILGALWPIHWLNSRVRSRHTDIRNELPYALDLLTLSVEAGLDFTEALGRITTKLGNSPLATELGQTLRDIQLGRTRAEALRNMSERLDLSEVNSIVSALIQADELGSNLGPILRIQSSQLRTTRSQEAERKALQAPVKILFPLIFFIFPCIFLMIGGPIIIKMMGSQ